MLILEHSFVKVLEQMSMINFMNYFLSTAAEGFVPSHAPLKNNKHLNIPFLSTQPRRGKNKSESQGLTPSSWGRACGMRRGVWGRASILSVMPNTAPDTGYHVCFSHTSLPGPPYLCHGFSHLSSLVGQGLPCKVWSREADQGFSGMRHFPRSL